MERTNADSFPHASLYPRDATPRITPGDAEELLNLSERLHKLGMGGQECCPAIMVAFFCKSGLVKYVVNKVEASDTIDNMTKALAAAAAQEATA